MKKNNVFLFCILLCVSQLWAQQTYSWNDKGLTLLAPPSFQADMYGYGMSLEDGTTTITIEEIGGMEGIKGLAGSLDSFAEGFDYKSSEKAQPFENNNNIKAALLHVQKDGKSFILAMFADNNYQKHFTFEANYSGSTQSMVMQIFSSISFGTASQNSPAVNTPKPVEEPVAPPVSQPQPKPNLPVSPSFITPDKNSELAPNFTLQNSKDGKTALSDFRGKIVLLDFWGTWCHPCIAAIPELKEFYTENKDRDFEILSIANDSNIPKWKKMLTDKGMNWSNVIDIDEEVQELYDIKSYPTMMLVGADGRFLSKNVSLSDIPAYLTKPGKPQTPQSSIPVQSNAPLPFNNTPVQKKVWSLLKAYSPDGYYILKDYYDAPGKYDWIDLNENDDFSQWIDGTSDLEIVKALGTVVHEINHGYTSKLPVKWMIENKVKADNLDYSAFYDKNRQNTVVRHTDVFTTNKINKIYPQEMITFRYDTYVYPSEPIMGSQQDGIYGLLDELNAYYQGAKVEYELSGYFEENASTPDEWLQFFSMFYSTCYSFLEFKSYILTYALYAQQHHADIYDKILNNADFIKALRTTDDNWVQLINDYKAKETALFSTLGQKGYNISKEDGFLYINYSGIGTFSDRYAVLKNGLSTRDYQRIAGELGLATSSGPNI